MLPNEMRSLIVYGSRANLRTVSVGPVSASGGIFLEQLLPELGDARVVHRRLQLGVRVGPDLLWDVREGDAVDCTGEAIVQAHVTPSRRTSAVCAASPSASVPWATSA